MVLSPSLGPLSTSESTLLSHRPWEHKLSQRKSRDMVFTKFVSRICAPVPQASRSFLFQWISDVRSTNQIFPLLYVQKVMQTLSRPVITKKWCVECIGGTSISFMLYWEIGRHFRPLLCALYLGEIWKHLGRLNLQGSAAGGAAMFVTFRHRFRWLIRNSD